MDRKANLMDLLRVNLSLAKKDGTKAKINVCLPFPQEELPQRLQAYDLIVTVKLNQELSENVGTSLTNKRYLGTWQYDIWTQDESLRNDCNEAIKTIMKEHARDVEGFTYAQKTNQKEDDKVGSPPLFHSVVSIATEHFG